MLTDRIEIRQRTVLPDGQVQVQQQKVIYDDGVEVARSDYHRHVVHPGQDLSKEHPDVASLCRFLHTPEVVAAYQSAEASANERRQAGG